MFDLHLCTEEFRLKILFRPLLLRGSLVFFGATTRFLLRVSRKIAAVGSDDFQ